MLFNPELLLQAAIFAVAACIAALFAKTERARVVRFAILFTLGIALRTFTLIFGVARGASFSKTIGFLGLLFEGMAFINIGAIFLFAVLLPLVRVLAPRIIRDLTIAFSYVALLIFLFSIHDVDVSGIVATSAVITAVIGFSLQDVLSNIMGGVALNLDNSVSAGDWVVFGDIKGLVREITWRHTVIESRNGDRYIVPNSQLMKNSLMLQGKRWDGSLKERRWVYFGVDYRFSPVTVMSVVEEALRREPIERVAAEPPLHCVMMNFEESWAYYAVRYWLTDLAADDLTDSVIRTRIYTALKRARIPVSIPSYVQFTQNDRGERQRAVEEERQDRIRALERVTIFGGLTREERETVADRLIFTPFVPGEAILVQGGFAHHLYILMRGVAEVRLSVDGQPPTTVARLDAPDFFGEMGMLTGEPRRAGVVAVTEVECWRLDKEKFEEILQARPAIAEEISRVLAHRNVELAAVREGLSEEAMKKRIASEHKSLLARIERFFGL